MTSALPINQLPTDSYRTGNARPSNFHKVERLSDFYINDGTTLNGLRGNENALELTASDTKNVSRQIAGFLSIVIFFALLVLLVLVAIPYGTVNPEWEAVFECAVFALTALWIVEGLLGGAWNVKGWPLLLPLVAVIVFAFVQTLPWWGAGATAGISWRRTLSVDPYETRLFVFKLSALTLVLALLLRHTSTRLRLRALIVVVIGIGVGSAVFGILRQTLQRDAPTFAWINLANTAGYAQFVNRNHFALLAEMSLGLALGMLAAKGVRRERVLFYMAAAFALWTTIVLSNSRGGIFSMLGQMIFVALVFVIIPRSQRDGTREQDDLGWATRIGKSPVVRFALVACLLGVVAVGVVLVGGESVATRLGSVTGEIEVPASAPRTGEQRLQIWDATIKLIKDHPIVGSGFSAFSTAISKHHDASGEVAPQEAHNDYLELVASGGLIGLLLAAMFVIALIKGVRKQIHSTNYFRRAACLGAVAGLIGVAIHSLFDFGLHITVNAAIMEALVAIAIVDVKWKKLEGRPETEEEPEVIA